MRSLITLLREGGDREMENKVTITTEEYDRLLEAENKLDALEVAGVDNWEGYEFAMEDNQ